MLLPAWTDAKPLIGVVHLKALPGAPGFTGSMDEVRDAALRDAAAYVEGGAHGVIVENFGDAPFFPGSVPATTTAAMSILVGAVAREVDVPVGVNVLRNDGLTALAVATASGAQFLRVNVLSGARLGDQGILRGMAHRLLRQRADLDSRVAILADVDVKHSVPLGRTDFAREVRDTVERCGAEGVIVTGDGTGHPPTASRVAEAREAAGGAPVFLGSGAAPNAGDLLAAADGIIVGTWCKRDGRVENPVDPDRVKTLAAAIGSL